MEQDSNNKQGKSRRNFRGPAFQRKGNSQKNGVVTPIANSEKPVYSNETVISKATVKRYIISDDLINKYLSNKFTIWGIVALLIYIFIVNAWVSDDAYITFRVIDNFVNGYGLTWNTTERVQAYTHPLWLMINIPFYFITREPFFTPIFVSFAFLLLTIFIVKILQSNNFLFVLILLFLCSSKAFIDYTSSGLENPLSYFLIAGFIYIYINPQKEIKKQLFLLSLTSSLLMMSRLDYALLTTPALIYVFYQNKSWTNLKLILAGLLPLIIWHSFTLIYYGFPFPNTAYAKLNTSIPSFDLVKQGFNYLSNSLRFDPITLVFILGSIVLSIVYARKRKELLFLSIGNFIYLVYIVKIGGDFMSGRFLSVVFLSSVIILSFYLNKINKSRIALISLFIIVIGLFQPFAPIKSTREYSLNTKTTSPKSNIKQSVNIDFFETLGITDERAFYFPTDGLLNNILGNKLRYRDQHYYSAIGSRYNNQFKVYVVRTIGKYGFYSGKDVHIIDRYALTDALLARLPVTDSIWRIGHFNRKLPVGYYETLNTFNFQFIDTNIAKLYNKLHTIISDPILSIKRFKTIFEINSGIDNVHIQKSYSSSQISYPWGGNKKSLLEWKYIDLENVNRNENYGLFNKYLNDLIQILSNNNIYDNPEDVDSWFIKAKIYADLLKNYQESISCYNNAIKYSTRPDVLGSFWYNKGIIYSKLKQFDKEVECYDSAIVYRPDHFGTWNNKGLALKDLGRTAEAEACFRKAKELKVK